jgi:hypothetical protein
MDTISLMEISCEKYTILQGNKCSFDPYVVRFDAYIGFVVLRNAQKRAMFSRNGPQDTL